MPDEPKTQPAKAPAASTTPAAPPKPKGVYTGEERKAMLAQRNKK